MLKLRQLFPVFLSLLFSTATFAGQSGWVFVWVSSGSNSYEIKQGTAKVTIKDGKINAYMKSTDGIDFKIVGTISNKHINAKFTILDSSYFINSPFSGTYEKKLWSGQADSKGRESITLTDGWNFIGLNHDIKP